jgi:hypothetical protein
VFHRKKINGLSAFPAGACLLMRPMMHFDISLNKFEGNWSISLCMKLALTRLASHST